MNPQVARPFVLDTISPIPDERPPVTESDWLRYLLPLPRQVEIPSSVTCSRKAVRVAAAGPADEVLEEAAALLTEAVGHGCEEAPHG